MEYDLVSDPNQRAIPTRKRETLTCGFLCCCSAFLFITGFVAVVMAVFFMTYANYVWAAVTGLIGILKVLIGVCVLVSNQPRKRRPTLVAGAAIYQQQLHMYQQQPLVVALPADNAQTPATAVVYGQVGNMLAPSSFDRPPPSYDEVVKS